MIFSNFILQRFEVLPQNTFVWVVGGVNGFHVVAGKGSRQDMNELEEGLEGLIEKMRKMIFHLLGPLNINNGVEHIGQTVDILGLHLLFLLNSLYLQAHVPADPPNFGIGFHMIVHRKNGFVFGFESHVY
jgi:hypothetical protein